MIKVVNWNGELWTIDPATKTIYKKGDLHKNNSELLTIKITVGNYPYGIYGNIIYFQRNTDNACFKIENGIVTKISEKEFLSYKKMRKTNIKDPKSIRYFTDYVIAILCNDILKKKYKLECSIPLEASNAIKVISKSFSGVTSAQIRDLTVNIMQYYLPAYIDSTKPKKEIYNGFKKIVGENSSLIESIEQRIIKECEQIFNALNEQICLTIKSKEKNRQQLDVEKIFARDTNKPFNEVVKEINTDTTKRKFN